MTPNAVALWLHIGFIYNLDWLGLIEVNTEISHSPLAPLYLFMCVAVLEKRDKKALCLQCGNKDN